MFIKWSSYNQTFQNNTVFTKTTFSDSRSWWWFPFWGSQPLLIKTAAQEKQIHTVTHSASLPLFSGVITTTIQYHFPWQNISIDRHDVWKRKLECGFTYLTAIISHSWNRRLFVFCLAPHLHTELNGYSHRDSSCRRCFLSGSEGSRKGSQNLTELSQQKAHSGKQELYYQLE